MPRPEDHEDSRPDTPAQQAMIALAIPMMLLAGPLAGYFLGGWIGGIWEKGTAGGIVGALLGLVAGIRETLRQIRKISAGD